MLISHSNNNTSYNDIQQHLSVRQCNYKCLLYSKTRKNETVDNDIQNHYILKMTSLMMCTTLFEG